MKNEEHFFDSETENTEENIRKILDLLMPDYIGYNGKNLIGEAMSKGAPVPQAPPMRIGDKMSLLLVYQGIRETTRTNFIFDEKSVITDLCKFLSAKGTVNLKFSPVFEDNDIEGYHFVITYTNQNYDYEYLTKISNMEFDNEKMGKILGYPTQCVEGAVQDEIESDRPSSFLDCSDKEEKMLKSLILYIVPNKNQAEKALQKAKRRYDSLEQLDEIYVEKMLEDFEQRVEKLKKEDKNMSKDRVEEIRNELKNASPVSDLIDEKLIITSDGEVIRRF